jgi:hypothetical protein
LPPAMIKKKLSPSDYFILAANLLPVAGVLAWDWSPIEVFVVYCLETIIIGLLTLVKMAIVTVDKRNEVWYTQGGKKIQPGFVLMLFFLVHYGMFVAIQMGLFFSVSGIADKANIGFFSFFYKWPYLLSNDSLLMLGAFFFCYGLKMIYDFIITRQYRSASLIWLMFEPYGRIIVQQLTVILGSTFLSFGAGKVFIVIFAAIKIFFEIFIDYNRIINRATIKTDKESTQQ